MKFSKIFIVPFLFSTAFLFQACEKNESLAITDPHQKEAIERTKKMPPELQNAINEN